MSKKKIKLPVLTKKEAKIVQNHRNRRQAGNETFLDFLNQVVELYRAFKADPQDMERLTDAYLHGYKIKPTYYNVILWKYPMNSEVTFPYVVLASSDHGIEVRWDIGEDELHKEEFQFNSYMLERLKVAQPELANTIEAGKREVPAHE